jgi:predicted Rossmann fold nucleotide-binding protein DprA/Smf involved in DNA uptake
MKEFEVWLKSIATGLKTMAHGIHTIANMLNDMAKAQTPEKTEKAKPTPERKSKPVSSKVTKKAKPMGPKPTPAIKIVLSVIKRSKDGVDNETISKKTGLKKNQVSNALSQLKKTGKIKSVKRGVHKVS